MQRLVGGRALVDGSEFPEQIEPDEAGDDSGRVWDLR